MSKLFKISLNRVHDRVRITEGDEKLELYVDNDAMRLVAGLSKAQETMKSLSNESTPEQVNNAAMFFAEVIFGDEQAEKLMAFYHNDAGCVINVCGQYFTGRLGKLITKAQKKLK